MPTYQFQCDPDDGGCGKVIEIRCSYSDKKENQPKFCPNCRKRKTIYEVFSGGQLDFIPKTVGHLADKNSSKISADEKHHLTEKHNEYRNKPSKESSWVETEQGVVHRSQLQG